MIAVGAGAMEIIVATFVLNFRHFVMSLSFMNRLRDFGMKWKVPLSMGLTDETFAVSALHTKEAKWKRRLFLRITHINSLPCMDWGLVFRWGARGGYSGTVEPEHGYCVICNVHRFADPIGEKEWRVGLVAAIAMLINAVFSQFMSDGWAIVFGTVLGGWSAVFLLKEDAS